MFCPLNSKRRQREIVLESVSQRVGGVETINEHCLFSPRNWPRFLLGWLLWLNLPGGFVATYAQSTQLDRSRFTRPVLRVADTARQAPPAPDHPLAAPLRMAREKLAYSQQEIYDYSAILVKRERVGDALLAHQFISLKVRNERLDSQGGVAVPFSVYMYFVGPESLKGREVLWVKGQKQKQTCCPCRKWLCRPAFRLGWNRRVPLPCAINAIRFTTLVWRVCSSNILCVLRKTGVLEPGRIFRFKYSRGHVLTDESVLAHK